MDKLINLFLARVDRTERGASLVEYGLLVVAILVAVTPGITQAIDKLIP